MLGLKLSALHLQAALAACALTTAACGIGLSSLDLSADSFADSGSFDQEGGLDAGLGPTTIGDARTPNPWLGSPLCAVAAAGHTCEPDVPACATKACVTQAVPGGDASAGSYGGDGCDDGGAPSYACHVLEQPDAAYGPTCTPPGTGGDGAPCMRSTECGIGFECVIESKQGVCRHYCCDNKCGDLTQSFCNIEPMQGVQHAVPVCVQLPPPCTLLQPCPNAYDTCTLVNVNGATACVQRGPQGVGDECETAHCGEGLACHGEFPYRKCWQLCDTRTTGGCPAGLVCATNPSNFQDTNFGICQKP